MNNGISTVCRTLENVLTAMNLITVSGIQNCNIVAGCANDIRACINALQTEESNVKKEEKVE